MADETQQEVAEANAREAGRVEIRGTESKGWGLFALRDFAPGEVIFRATSLRASPDRTTHTIQKSFTEHIIMNLPARFINHSCMANTGIRDNDLGAYDFVANASIQSGQELTWDYSGAEFESISFDCLCGTAKCRGKIMGFKTDCSYIREAYGDNIADYLKAWTPDQS